LRFNAEGDEQFRALYLSLTLSSDLSEERG
jgi:hypothetical protein